MWDQSVVCVLMNLSNFTELMFLFSSNTTLISVFFNPSTKVLAWVVVNLFTKTECICTTERWWRLRRKDRWWLNTLLKNKLRSGAEKKDIADHEQKLRLF